MSSSTQGVAGHLAVLLLCLSASGCSTGRKQSASNLKPSTETELAARRLQEPLSKHLCKAAIYPAVEQDWKLVRVASVAGRGTDFKTALEALCREVDGRKLPAVVDIYYWRTPTGWSPDHELRGIAVRYEEGFAPPTPPVFDDIKPPEVARSTDEEPPPAGETARK